MISFSLWLFLVLYAVPFLLNYFPNPLCLSSGLLNRWTKGTGKAGAPVRERGAEGQGKEEGRKREGEVLCVNQ